MTADERDVIRAAQECPALSLCQWLRYYPGDTSAAYRDWSMYWTPWRLHSAHRAWVRGAR